MQITRVMLLQWPRAKPFNAPRFGTGIGFIGYAQTVALILQTVRHCRIAQLADAACPDPAAAGSRPAARARPDALAVSRRGVAHCFWCVQLSVFRSVKTACQGWSWTTAARSSRTWRRSTTTSTTARATACHRYADRAAADFELDFEFRGHPDTKLFARQFGTYPSVIRASGNRKLLNQIGNYVPLACVTCSTGACVTARSWTFTAECVRCNENKLCLTSVCLARRH